MLSFDGVSKRFIIHHAKSRSFQDLLLDTLRRNDGSREEFWALRDVSFNVQPGEAVGLIGPNGAGKSTCLKLVARIIEPTRGRITVKGRVGALLEVVAGFHEDLTGRENVFLSGALMGLTRRDIQSRFDEIVAFAEMEKFIDTPVKHYSTGMYMRLGFAIAATLEPDLLLIDESLAVGDASFQRKCLMRIAEIKRGGATILFVSHQAQQVEQLCSRAILLWEGQLRADGTPESAQAEYEQLRAARARERYHAGGGEVYGVNYLQAQIPDRMPAQKPLFVPITIQNSSTSPWEYGGRNAKHKITLSYHWLDQWGHVVTWDGARTELPREVAPGESITLEAEVHPPDHPGMYRLEVELVNEGVAWFSERGVTPFSREVQVIFEPLAVDAPATALPDSK